MDFKVLGTKGVENDVWKQGGYLSTSPHVVLVFDYFWVVSCVTTSDSNCFMTFSCPSKLVKPRWAVRASHSHPLNN